MLNASPSSFIIMPALAKIVCEPGWKWQKRERPMQNYDLFYVWSGEGTVELNDEPFAVGKGSCFLFRPGDHTSATHNPQKPLVLTYIHFDVTDPVQEIPASYRKLTETMDFEYLLARYVRLYLDKPYGSLEEGQLILKQLMIHLLRADLAEPVVKKQAISCPRRSMKSRITYASTRVFPIGSRIWRPERDCPPLLLDQVQGADRHAGTILHYSDADRAGAASAAASGDERNGGSRRAGVPGHILFSRQFKQYTGKSPSEIR